MPSITFVTADETPHVVEAQDGATLMQVGVTHAIPGIIGECGGSCMCATCHVVVDAADAGRLPPVSPEEADMLEYALTTRFDGSRLGCQIAVGPALDGLIVRVPT